MKLKGNKLQAQSAQILPLSSLHILLFSVFLHILFQSKLHRADKSQISHAYNLHSLVSSLLFFKVDKDKFCLTFFDLTALVF